MERKLNSLQKVQKATARIVHQTSFQTSATALRQQLHWLPIRQRITYKLVTLTCKAKYSRIHIFTNSFETIKLPEHFALLPLHCFTDHVCPPSSPLGRSTTLHLKFELCRDTTRSANTFSSCRRCLKSELFAAA